MLVELMSKLDKVSYVGVRVDKCCRGKEKHVERTVGKDNMANASVHSHSPDT